MFFSVFCYSVTLGVCLKWYLTTISICLNFICVYHDLPYLEHEQLFKKRPANKAGCLCLFSVTKFDKLKPYICLGSTSLEIGYWWPFIPISN